MKYTCCTDQCNVTIKGLTCDKCDEALVHDNIVVDGKTIQVSKCPKCGDKIKSPQCCGHDMEAIG
jgi:NAD-dependent SIR2 family protein deacetylase